MKRSLDGQGMLQSATSQSAPQFRRVRVLLLDKKEIFIRVENKNAKVSHIFEGTCQQCELKVHEAEVFGLAILKDGEYFFIEADTKLQKLAPKMWSQKEGANEPSLTFHFRVMYYVDDVRLLKHKAMRHLYYLQLRENLLNYNLVISEEKCFLLSAYALIADHGKFDAETHGSSDYFDPREYLPAWVIMRRGLDYMRQNLPVMHRELSSMSMEALMCFISELTNPPLCHNFHTYKLAKRKYDETDNFSVGVGPRGLDIFEPSEGFLRPTTSIVWAGVSKINCDKKKFELLSASVMGDSRRLTFFARSKEWCSHLRHLCKSIQKWQIDIQPQVNEFNRQESRDATWRSEKKLPNEPNGDCMPDRVLWLPSGIPAKENGKACTSIFDLSAVVASSEISDIGLTGIVANGDGIIEDYVHQNHGVGKEEEESPQICSTTAEKDGIKEDLDLLPAVGGETPESFIATGPLHVSLTPPEPFDTPIMAVMPAHTTEVVPAGADFDMLNFTAMNMNDEILIDTPPNTDLHNITTVTPLSSNLSPLDPAQVVRSSTPKNTNVYRHTSYLGTPLTPYLNNQLKYQQQQQHHHQPPPVSSSSSSATDHLLSRQQDLFRQAIRGASSSSSNQSNPFWRASCSGRLMKRQLRSFDFPPVQSTEHIPKLLPQQQVPYSSCLYKSTPLSIYIPFVQPDRGVHPPIRYSGESGTSTPGILSRMHKNSIDENVNDASSDLALVLGADRLQRPPPPSYEVSVARKNSTRMATSNSVRGLDFDADELVTCDSYHSSQEYNWSGRTGGGSGTKLSPSNILDYQFPLLTTNGLDDNYCLPIVSSSVLEAHQQPRTDFMPEVSKAHQRPCHRSSLNSHEQWIQYQQQQQQQLPAILQACQPQPQKVKAALPLYAEQVPVSTPLSKRKDFQLFDRTVLRGSSNLSGRSELKVPVKALRKASSTESEPGEGGTRNKPVQRHNSSITTMKNYYVYDEPTKPTNSYPLVNALLKDPSLQQNVRSFPSDLAALVSDTEHQQQLQLHQEQLLNKQEQMLHEQEQLLQQEYI